ncbi:LacI family DNA-binding transcriptional regulator [Lederbergia citri]|uniref:LacI family DNA-binding transcriptional regulator n=1 Tax=Lederbergia citri TaxID=2833580 RepID=A0A942YKR3_9BACI|nr:LacI family DNA-binding transcriptional regulator [Lederbergia citri]MBS4197616.1 LacI family DNA-binding transcriptional regulator [Lederbergia citri]
MNKVTIKDIAKESGVSTATVSRVLSNTGYASDEIKERVRKVARSLNYQPNAIARSLKIDRTNTIGVIIPDISNPYFMRISRGIEDTLQNENYYLLFVSGDENQKKERKMLRVLMEKRVDAIVLATSGGNDELINQINNSGVPIVLIDRKLQNDTGEIDSVVENNLEGAYQLTKQLIQQGHTNIGVINGSLKVSTGMERYIGYQKAMDEYCLGIESELIFNGNFIEDDGVKAITNFYKLDRKPTAILSFNNTMTFGAIIQLRKMGLTIPKDIVVASYGETEAAQLLESPSILHVKQLPYEIGVKVGKILIDRLINNIKGPTNQIFNPIIDISE